MNYEQLREVEENIVFYVASDYSDIDIENFKRVFKIRKEDRVLRITKRWQKLINKCKREKKSPPNFLVIINESGKAKQVQKF